MGNKLFEFLFFFFCKQTVSTMSKHKIFIIIITTLFISLTNIRFPDDMFIVSYSFADTGARNKGINKGTRLEIYSNVEQMRIHFVKETQLCYVSCDDSRYSDGYKGNFYEYIDHSEFGEIELYNGGFAKLLIPSFTPLKDNNDECIQTILKIASTYMNVGVKYKSQNGPFKLNPDLWNGIQCSQFVSCILYGLTFQNLKLFNPGNTNPLIPGGLRYGIERLSEGGYSAWQLARFAAGHGWFCETSTFESVKLGDVVFFYNNNVKNNNWKGISHTAMVVGKNHGKVVLVEAGGLTDHGNQLFEYYKPNEASDAVNFIVVLDENTVFCDDEYGLFGFARFPLYYGNQS